MNGGTREHSTRPIPAGDGFWRWQCGCGREGRHRFTSQGAADQSGASHEYAKNQTPAGTE